MSDLFLLRKFCSVAKLSFKCLTCHFRLEFPFDIEISIIKVYQSGFFILLFFETLWKILFQKGYS